MADITFSIDADAGETIFSASTPKGDKFLGSPELTVPNSEAKDYVEKAKSAGLVVVPFP